jgi:hypothetical protein
VPVRRVQRRRITPQINRPGWIDGTRFDPNPHNFIASNSRFHDGFAINETSSPFQIVREFVTEELVTEICNETNRYAEDIMLQNPRALRRWCPLDSAEFWKFMSLSTLMGLIKKSAVKDYWSTDELIATPQFGKTMPRDR